MKLFLKKIVALSLFALSVLSVSTVITQEAAAATNPQLMQYLILDKHHSSSGIRDTELFVRTQIQSPTTRYVIIPVQQAQHLTYHLTDPSENPFSLLSDAGYGFTSIETPLASPAAQPRLFTKHTLHLLDEYLSVVEAELNATQMEQLSKLAESHFGFLVLLFDQNQTEAGSWTPVLHMQMSREFDNQLYFPNLGFMNISENQKLVELGHISYEPYSKLRESSVNTTSLIEPFVIDGQESTNKYFNFFARQVNPPANYNLLRFDYQLRDESEVLDAPSNSSLLQEYAPIQESPSQPEDSPQPKPEAAKQRKAPFASLQRFVSAQMQKVTETLQKLGSRMKNIFSIVSTKQVDQLLPDHVLYSDTETFAVDAIELYSGVMDEQTLAEADKIREPIWSLKKSAENGRTVSETRAFKENDTHFYITFTDQDDDTEARLIMATHAKDQEWGLVSTSLYLGDTEYQFAKTLVESDYTDEYPPPLDISLAKNEVLKRDYLCLPEISDPGEYYTLCFKNIHLDVYHETVLGAVETSFGENTTRLQLIESEPTVWTVTAYDLQEYRQNNYSLQQAFFTETYWNRFRYDWHVDDASILEIKNERTPYLISPCCTSEPYRDFGWASAELHPLAEGKTTVSVSVLDAGTGELLDEVNEQVEVVKKYE